MQNVLVGHSPPNKPRGFSDYSGGGGVRCPDTGGKVATMSRSYVGGLGFRVSGFGVQVLVLTLYLRLTPETEMLDSKNLTL